MTENPFSELMKGHSNTALAAVIQDREHYQPAAVEAALTELAQRNISPDELLLLQDALSTQPDPQSDHPLYRLRAFTGRFISRMNPFQYTGVERDMSMIIVSISYYLLVLVISGYGTLLQTLAGSWLNTHILITSLPYLVLLPGLVLFHKRQRFGWLLLSTWAVWSIGSIVSLCLLFFQSREGYFMYQPLSPSSLLVGFFIFGGIFYALLRQPIRKSLRIPADWILLAISLGIALSWFLRYS